MKPQVSQHFAESCQVTEIGLTEPGLLADSLRGVGPGLRRGLSGVLPCGAVASGGELVGQPCPFFEVGE